MNTLFRHLFLSLLFSLILRIDVQSEPLGRWTIKVVDEEERPVPNALVSMGFERDYQADQRVLLEGKSDSNGLFSAESATDGDVVGGASKEGYYETYGIKPEFNTFEKKRWQPWNPTNVIILKRIIHPVPMFARRVRIVIPVFDKPVGYDLGIGDWNIPYGKGTNSDMTFIFSGRFVNFRDRDETLTIKFDKEGDGIQQYFADYRFGSALRLPHKAPENGYEKSWSQSKIMKSDGTRSNQEVRKDRNFIFRIRSISDEKGSIEEAKYGKIYGDIEFGYSRSNEVMVIFTYYLNPDGTRNLEFDPKRNLFKNLKQFEQVHEP